MTGRVGICYIYNMELRKIEEVTVKGVPLADILEEHKMWLANRAGGRRAELSNADLNWVDLHSVNLRGAMLDGARLTYSTISDCILSDASMERAILYKANITHSRIDSAVLRLATMDDCSITNTSMENANMDGANMKHAKIDSSSMKNAVLTDTTLDGAAIKRSVFSYAKMHRASLNACTFENDNMDHTLMDYCRGVSAVFMSCSMPYICMSGVYMPSAKFICCNMDSAELRMATLNGVEFTETDMEYASLEDTVMDESELIRKGKILDAPVTGYKKTRCGDILEAEIPAGAIVFSINNQKCRTNRARIVNTGGKVLRSFYKPSFTYSEGQEIVIPDFNLQYNAECAPGFHFFRTKEEAEAYEY